LVSKLGTIAASPQVDLNLVISPFVAVLLQLRDAARLSERWADADAIRDWLLEMKITITDSKTETTWKMDI
jgi:cysteinyl-tRNA synthetase